MSLILNFFCLQIDKKFETVSKRQDCIEITVTKALDKYQLYKIFSYTCEVVIIYVLKFMKRI